MKAYILNDKVHIVLDYANPAYSLPSESWSPLPEALFEFNTILAPFIKEQETPYDAKREWFDAAFVLGSVKQAKQEDLAAAFIRIETKQPRNARGLILSFVDGSFPRAAYAADMLTNIPDAEAPTLTPDQEQRIIDVGIMYEIEELVEYNRGLLRELKALTITDDMTLEEAQAVVLKAVSIKPWVPVGGVGTRGTH